MSMSTSSLVEEAEDILQDSLQSLYDYTPVTYSSAGSLYTYTSPDSRVSMVLRTPDPHPSNWSLHASSIWIAALYVADHIDLFQPVGEGARPRVLEIGAGAGLPGILLAKTRPDCSVVLSDYPDSGIIDILEENVRRNEVKGVKAVGYDWCADVLPSELKLEHDFDMILAADTLWNSELHRPMLRAIERCLKERHHSRAYLIAGMHTGRYTIQGFLDLVEQSSGLEIEVVDERLVGSAGIVSRRWETSREGEDEASRRKWVVFLALRRCSK